MKTVKELTLIMGITAIGEFCNQVLPFPVPAGVYGLFLLLSLLGCGALHLDDVEETGNFLLDHMTVMFIPAGVGIIQYTEQLKNAGMIYLFIIIISTLVVFAVTGKITQMVIKKEKKYQDSNEETDR